MPTDTALIEKREELKRRLAAGEYKTLVDIVLVWTDHQIRKITRRSEPLPIWLITADLILVLALVSFSTIYAAADLPATRSFVASLGLDYKLVAIVVLTMPGVLNLIGLISSNQYIRKIFILWRDDVLDATETVASLNEFEAWLDKVCNRRMHLLFTVIGGLLNSLYVVITIPYLGMVLGYGPILVFVNMLAYGFIYLLVMIINLTAIFRRYDLTLFPADPASSQLISRLSGILGFFVYFVAGWGAYLTLGVAAVGLFPSFGIAPVITLWLPIITMFILNQTGLSSMIRRAKWKTLNEIQAKVEKLQATENFEDKETMDTINRLMDYHDRVKRTRNTAIDLSTALNFINSLLLPLLAFVIGNLSLVLSLFKKQP